MLIMHVHVMVKQGFIEAFKTATVENAKMSIKEPGIVRFDIVQSKDDSAKFILIEAYRTSEDPARHKETDHYKKWRDEVEKMMAEPRASFKFSNVFPMENAW